MEALHKKALQNAEIPAFCSALGSNHKKALRPKAAAYCAACESASESAARKALLVIVAWDTASTAPALEAMACSTSLGRASPPMLGVSLSL